MLYISYEKISLKIELKIVHCTSAHGGNRNIIIRAPQISSWPPLRTCLYELEFPSPHFDYLEL